jgi:organic hydroperoxide reductase OsmC/OhrA
MSTSKSPPASPARPKPFQEAAANAKKGCPISRLLNTEITMNARLEP